MEKGGFVYILSNRRNTVLYIGVTSDLNNRMYEHLNKIYKDSYTKRYNIEKLIYFEIFSSIEEAICREKQLKAGSRKKKEELINLKNPQWNDLYPEILEW